MMATQTLDQQRAAYAWDAVKRARTAVKEFDDFKNLAKGAPALIMGNGLMPALAFYESRKEPSPAPFLNQVIHGWLATRFIADPAFKPVPKTYGEVMERLFNAPSSFYMQATDETLAVLKWLRQFADAVSQEGS